MRSSTGTIRFVEASHDLDRKNFLKQLKLLEGPLQEKGVPSESQETGVYFAIGDIRP